MKEVGISEIRMVYSTRVRKRGMFRLSNRFLSPMAVPCPLPPSCGKFCSISGIAASIAYIMRWFMRDRVRPTEGTAKSSKSESMSSKNNLNQQNPFLQNLLKRTHVLVWLESFLYRGLPGLFIASAALKVTEGEDLILREVYRTDNTSCHNAGLCKEFAL